MKLCFTKEQIDAGLNRMKLEDVDFTAKLLYHVSGNVFRMDGSAVVEGETYDEFCVEFETDGKPDDMDDIESILGLDWVDYGFVFA